MSKLVIDTGGVAARAATPRTSTLSPGSFRLHLLFLLSFVYLLIELPFNARLLDVIGNLPGPEALEHLEVTGRILSGTALMLAILGIAFSGPRLPRFAVPIFVLSVLCLPGAYYGIRAIVDGLVDRSQPEDRRLATGLVPMTRVFVNGGLKINALEMTKEEFISPGGKVLIGSLSMVVSWVPGLLTQLENSAQEIVKRELDARTGGLDDAYRSYHSSLSAIRSKYLSFRKDATAQSGPDQAFLDQEWSNYKQSVRRATNGDIENLHPKHYDKVREHLRSKGVNVRDDWMPSDRAGFEEAVIASYRREAGRAIAKKTEASLGRAVTGDISEAEFALLPKVQQEWRESLKLPKGVTVRPGMSVADFNTEVYERTLTIRAREAMESVLGRVNDYRDGGRLETAGKDAYRAMIAPPIALMFSLLGGLFHVCKTTNMGVRLLRKPRLALPAALGVGALALSIPFWAPAGMRAKPAVDRALAHTPLAFQAAASWGFSAQPLLYPVNKWLLEKQPGGLLVTWVTSESKLLTQAPVPQK